MPPPKDNRKGRPYYIRMYFSALPQDDREGHPYISLFVSLYLKRWTDVLYFASTGSLLTREFPAQRGKQCFSSHSTSQLLSAFRGEPIPILPQSTTYREAARISMVLRLLVDVELRGVVSALQLCPDSCIVSAATPP